MTSWHTQSNILEERILRGLQAEWKIASQSLNPHSRHRLLVPGFELRDLTDKWGIWEGARNNIVLSRKLVLEYPWKTVREVLRHEMAHQAADQLFGAYGRPHGDLFREACRLLGADPCAAGKFPSIYEMEAQGELAGNDRIMLRVKKLLAMAQSSNKNEAELAMAKAHEHIALYNIDLLGMDKDRDYCSLCLGEPALRNTTDAYALADLLRTYYFVETIWLPMYVLEAGKPGSILEISGTCANVRLAEYVYEFLRRTINDQWAVFIETHRAGYRKKDFALGLIAGFREKLASQSKAMQAANPQTTALIAAGDRRLGAYFRERHPHIRTVHSKSRCRDEKAHAAGHAAGRQTILHKPVSQTAASRRLLLT